jgi:hypothetical protein
VSDKRSVVCKRCGDLDHYAKTCPFPKVDGGRPNLEELAGSRGEQRTVGAYVVQKVLRYTREIETHRRNPITLVRELQTRSAK